MYSSVLMKALFIISLFPLLFSIHADASDQVKISCTVSKSSNVMGVLTSSEKIKCATTLPNSSFKMEETSLSELGVFCISSSYELKVKLNSKSEMRGDLNVRIVQNKKNIFGKTKEKTLSSGSLAVGMGITSKLNLSQSLNGNGIDCEFKAE